MGRVYGCVSQLSPEAGKSRNVNPARAARFPVTHIIPENTEIPRLHEHLPPLFFSFLRPLGANGNLNIDRLRYWLRGLHRVAGANGNLNIDRLR